MPERQLTGGRIRERRIALGLRQAELAPRAGISASYLNLIEHNRRRIGGKRMCPFDGDICDHAGPEDKGGPDQPDRPGQGGGEG